MLMVVGLDYTDRVYAVFFFIHTKCQLLHVRVLTFYTMLIIRLSAELLLCRQDSNRVKFVQHSSSK